MEQSVERNPDLIDTLQRYADLFTFAPVGCVVLTESSRVDDVNRVAAATLGWPRSWVIGQLFSRWIVRRDLPRFLDHLRTACRSEEPLTGEFRIEDRRGLRRDLRFDSIATMARQSDPLDRVGYRERRCQLTMVEATDLHAVPPPGTGGVRDELAHAARLSSCGEMAAALVHELNQPLGAIALYCNASVKGLRAGTVQPEKLAESLEKVANAATHAASTVRGLRGFLRKSESGVEVMPLNDVIRSGAQLAAPYAREHGVKIVLRLADALPSVRVNRTHLQQVLLNLLQNGIDALHESNCDEKRRILVTTDSEDLFNVRVAVADTGPGMTEQQRRRAFEPFYTTKSNGMGMGLPISRMIIESYGGRLYAPPTRRRGATVAFTLPVHQHD